MSNKTDMWMPLYVADYLSSTTRLTTEQHGAYLLLIIDYWKNGRLPDDDSILANVTRLTVDAWAKHRGVLEGFFEVVNGEWIHSRIEKELEKSGDLKKTKIKKSILGNFVKYGKIDPRVETDPELIEWWAIESLRHSPKASLKDTPKAPPSPSPTHLSKDKIESAPRKRSDTPRPKSEQTTLEAYIQKCKANNAKPVPDDHSVRAWAHDVGITLEMLQIAWIEFRRRYTETEKAKGKKYKDWPGHFANAVKANWFGVWFFGDNGVQWSSKGLGFKAAEDVRMNRMEADNG